MSILSISSASTLDQQHQLVSTTKKMKKDSHDYDVVTSHLYWRIFLTNLGFQLNLTAEGFDNHVFNSFAYVGTEVRKG